MQIIIAEPRFYMLIAYTDLSEDALNSLAKEWVISKLSDTENFPQVEEWTQSTLVKIKNRELLIEFGEESQTVYLKTADELGIDSKRNNNE